MVALSTLFEFRTFHLKESLGWRRSVREVAIQHHIVLLRRQRQKLKATVILAPSARRGALYCSYGSVFVPRLAAGACIARFCGRSGLLAVASIIKAIACRSIVYNGTLLGRYLKSHPASGPAPHYWPPIKGQDNEARGVLGSQFKVFHLDFGPVGILQCYDGYFPEAWGCTSYLGAEIILWINGREGMIEDSHCLTASQAYGCVVAANISNGKNTGFAGLGCITNARGTPEESRLYPRIKVPGDDCIHATIDLAKLRWKRKHLRTMHQRRPDMYHLLTQDVTMWQNYPEIPWDYPECAELVNRAQL